jgi:hypothetical protein
LVQAIKLIHRNTAIIPEAYHDAKKLMMLLDIKAEKAIDVGELKDLLSESVVLMNLQLPNANASISNTEDANFTRFIKRTIESTKIDKRSNAKIISNIQFSDRYNEINNIKLGYMMGLLLEHALDTLTKRPIFIDINSSKDRILIQVAYEYKFEKNLIQLKNFLVDNDFDRSKINNNLCLLKLKSLVETLNGKSVITREKNIHEQVDYLSISLIFSEAGDQHE